MTGALLAACPALAQVGSPEADPNQAFEIQDPRAVPPLPLPQIESRATDLTDQGLLASPRGPSKGLSGNGHPPLVLPDDFPGFESWLDTIDPDLPEPRVDRESFEPLAETPTGWPYTTTRVFPRELAALYPYLTIGRLTFLDPPSGRSGSCTGAVINRRLVLTAGHCVYDATNRRWFTSWAFYPAYYDGASPTGPWFARQAWTTNAWIRGRERFPNRSDFGILIMFDRFIGNAVRPIGEVTGWLGWQTRRFRHHFNQFGYPHNLDATRIPQNTGAQVAQNNYFDYRWGTNQLNGSSGGPLVENFGQNADGQSFFTNSVVGVVSFGNASQGIAGTSKFRNNFVSLVRAACNAQPDNCAP